MSPIIVTLAFWFGLALAIGWAGLLRNAPAPAIPVTAGTLTALAVLACTKVRIFRVWANTVSLRSLIALHLTRFIGFYFILRASHGTMPPVWAIPAGIGDNLVAAGAVALLATKPSPRWLLLA